MLLLYVEKLSELPKLRPNSRVAFAGALPLKRPVFCAKLTLGAGARTTLNKLFQAITAVFDHDQLNLARLTSTRRLRGAPRGEAGNPTRHVCLVRLILVAELLRQRRLLIKPNEGVK